MNVQGLAALLTASAVVVGAVWSVLNGRKQRSTTEASSLWDEAMDIIARLREENDRLRAENATLKLTLDKSRKRPARRVTARSEEP